MKPESLLKPRWKVVANYPESAFFVGQVIMAPNFAEDFTSKFWAKDKDNFPHLFKKLEWWEERKVGDMPEYISNKQGTVLKVQWTRGAVTENGQQPMRMKIEGGVGDWQVIPNVMCFYEPATETEYLKTQKQTT